MKFRKEISLLFGITLSLLCFSNECISAPTIESVVNSGDSFIISGSSFSSKAKAAPLHFDNFEQGKNGQAVSLGDYWSSYDEGNPIYNSTNQRNIRSSLNAKFKITNADEFYRIIPELKRDNSKLFLSFWLYIDIEGTGWLDTGTNPQLKVMRLTNNGSYSDPPHMLWQSFTDDQVLYEFDQSYISADDSGGNSLGGGLGRGESYNGGMLKPKKGGWLNVQVQYQNAVAPNVTTIKWRESYGDLPYQGVNYNKITPVLKSGGPYLDTIKLGFHAEHADGGYNYWDDIYIDNSWARVEIGDASTYENCSRREMQIPTSWSPDSITIKVNSGSFNDGEYVYLFVLDTEGNASSGHKIMIGESSGLEPPYNPRVVEN